MNFKKPIFWDNPKFSLWILIFYPFSIIFYFFSLINKLKKKKKFQIPIICVGNIYIGGTGKTPLVKEIFNITKSLGKNPGIIKKYYKYLDDEITMLKKVGKIFVDKKRIDSMKSLIKNKNDLAILDDGFQDYTLEKNFSILCFNQKQWIGNGFLIPCGPLREKISAIKRANCIFINGKKNNEIEKKIYNENNQIKIFYSKYKALNIDKYKNKKIYAFAGIGNPLNFFDLLKENNLELVGEEFFPDHYSFTKNDINILKKKAEALGAILLTTEKDFFRIMNEVNKEIDYLEIKVEIENKDNFIEFIKNKI